jgi:hypothetical protein
LPLSFSLPPCIWAISSFLCRPLVRGGRVGARSLLVHHSWTNDRLDSNRSWSGQVSQSLGMISAFFQPVFCSDIGAGQLNWHVNVFGVSRSRRGFRD